jgi:hypothetical protein
MSIVSYRIGKGKAIPLQALTGSEGSKRLKLPDFKTIHTWRWQGCQPYALASFTPRKYRLYPSLLESESNPGSYCGRKDYVNEKFLWHHWESIPRPSGFERSASTNCATSYPQGTIWKPYLDTNVWSWVRWENNLPLTKTVKKGLCIWSQM